MNAFPRPEPSLKALPRLTERSQRRVGRVAALAMMVVVAGLIGGALYWGTLLSRAGEAVAQAVLAGENLTTIRRAIGNERTLDRETRFTAPAQQDARQQEATATIAAALQELMRIATPAERPMFGEIRNLHDEYLQIAARNRPSAPGDTLDEASAYAALRRLETSIDTATTRVHATAEARVRRLIDLQTVASWTAPIAAIFGLGLTALLFLVQRLAQRQRIDGLLREAAAICRKERLFRGLVEHAPDLQLVCTAAGHITFQSPAAEIAWGYGAGGLRDRSLLTLVHPGDQAATEAFWREVRASPPEAPPTRLEARLYDGLGKWRPAEFLATNQLDDGDIQGIVLTIHDLSRPGATIQQAAGALHDPVTRLPNRDLFADRLDRALVRSARQRDGLVLLLLTIAPATMERAAAASGVDDLAIDVTARLRACLRASDTIARLGPARFAIIHEFGEGRDDARTLARAIADKLGQPFQTAGALVADLGLALADLQRDTPEQLLAKAELAANQAQARRADGPADPVQWALFQPDARRTEHDIAELTSDLRSADLTTEMRVHYQPIVQIDTGELEGVEALVRWQHPTQGLVPPNDFVPIAEETGLIVPLGRWVLGEACRQLVAWQAKYNFEPPLTLSVNLSPRQFHGPTLVADVARALLDAGLAAKHLKLDIPESALMRDLDATVQKLWALDQLGVGLAVDDFGTGYSSMFFLKQLPLDLLKIDGAFIRNLGHDEEDTAIVRAIIARAKSLGLKVTGESIETEQQAAMLAEMGCHYGQGYLYSRAVDELDAAAFLRTPAPPARVAALARS